MLNQYSAITPPDPAPAIAPVHDFDGNQLTGHRAPVTGAPLTFEWDGENRLKTVKDAATGAVIESNTYDHAGRRVRTVTPAAGTDVAFLYDGWNVVAEYRSGTVPPSNFILQTSKTWGMDLSGSMQGAGGVGGLLATASHDAASPGTWFPTYDGNGNVSEYLDPAGTPAAHFEYDPFGNTVVNTDTANRFPIRFSTKPYSPVTGLYYYGYRYYEPVTGRWPSRDPIGEGGGFNLSAFLRNHAISSFDSDGRAEFDGNGPIQYNDASKRWHGADGKFVPNPGFPIPPEANRDPKVPNLAPNKGAEKTAKAVTGFILDAIKNANKKVQLRLGLEECEKRRVASGAKTGCGCCETRLKFNIMFIDPSILGVHEFAGAKYSSIDCVVLKASRKRDRDAGLAVVSEDYSGGVGFPKNWEWSDQFRGIMRDREESRLFMMEYNEFPF